MTWIGLTSENEFYSAHYLAEIFSNDVRGVLEAWAAKEAEAKDLAKGGGEREPAWRTPWARLAGLSREALQTLEDLNRDQTPLSRLVAGRQLTRQLLELFELPYAPERIVLQERVDSPDLPLLGELRTRQDDPFLWVLEAISLNNGQDFDADPLGMTINPEQLKSLQDLPIPRSLLRDDAPDWQKLLASSVFTQAVPPRWVLLVSPFQWLLLDRAKFAQHRLLRFDWVELLSRREAETLKAVSVLLHRDSLLDAQGTSLLDSLEENAHKHAYAVSEDLKYALRECIELLGDYSATSLIEQARAKKEGIYTGEKALDPNQLSMECLRYIYRLLFLFYIEARPELGYAPVGSEVYLKGYSLECMRDLELMPLTLESERNGRFLNDSLQCLFRLVAEGTEEQGTLDLGGDQAGRDAFEMRPLRCHLFDLKRTEMLNKVVFPNELLQKVIQLMSLSRPGHGRQRRGRISYAQLGINQLGAVYEALLSYRGFFAQEELFEVKKADTPYDELEMGFFVNAQALNAYTEEEKVFEPNERGEQRLKKHPKGSFIYRLAGRDREKSASYYTPEVLTRSLVKYALKELVKEQLDPLPNDQAKAEKILGLRICEPAMGSAAFLNEAVSQLADLYLERMQRARNERIAQDQYAIEKQRVKMYLADNCVFGVDLNPVAVELAEVSLWLNALSADRFVPWFGLQLHCGNSLIGARRQVYDKEQLKRKASDPASWLCTAPTNLAIKTGRKAGQIWHFLLPDSGMAAYADKEVKALYPEQIKAINVWRKDFSRPFTPGEIARLETLSAKLEALWQEHAATLAAFRLRTADPYAIYGRPAEGRTTDLSFKDKLQAQELWTEGVTNASAYRRLKLAMDYGCALWFWPIDRFEDLPSREEWFFDLENLLLGDTRALNALTGTSEPAKDAAVLQAARTPNLFPRPEAVQKNLFEQAQSFTDRFGVVDLDKLRKTSPRFKLAEELAEQRRFFHWELEFADLFRDNGGFDLTLGNPPWLKVEWDSGAVLGDFEPRYVIRNFSGPELANLREATFTRAPALEATWRSEFEERTGTQSFLNAVCNYPLLIGQKANLYKCFLPQSWDHASHNGVSGFLHPEGVYDDPNGGGFRSEMYLHLRAHFQYQNEKKLFPIGNRSKFSANIYGPRCEKPVFDTIANLFSPRTVDLCYSHDGSGVVNGIKDEETETWDESGHKDRIVSVRMNHLTLFAQLYDEPGTPALEARLPALHAKSLLKMLEQFAAQPRRLGDFEGEYYSTYMFDEAQAQRDGTTRRETRFSNTPDEWILSGPHFHVGNPFFQTPKEGCNTHRAYDNLDLLTLPDDYLPRTNYVPSCPPTEYKARTPRVNWTEEGKAIERLVTDYYRVFFRRQLSQSGERTLIGAIVPPGPAHIHPINSITFKDPRILIEFAGSCSSLVFDFWLKTTGKGDLYESVIRLLPVFEDFPFAELGSRIMILTSLTSHYAPLWASEHTGLMEGELRRKVEESFINGHNTWDVNLLSATPTLEMGIDIGDLSSVLLCSVPPAQTNYLQRIGRAGRRDGNALALTIANGRPHDLFFYAAPSEMIAGKVSTPGVFLKAMAVLERQLIAFCFDRWVETGVDARAIPNLLKEVLDAVADSRKDVFPYTLLGFVEAKALALLEGFLAIFPSPEKDLVLKRLDGEERRIHFAQFIEGGGSEGTLGYRVLNRLTELVQTRQGLRDRCQELKKRIDQLVTQPVDEESTLLLAACRNERQALLTLVGSINRRQTLNFFTDEGLLPNYAFPEEGVTLNSVILRRRELREDGETGSPFEKFQFSFQRSAQAALGELVPDANFYAAEHRLNIEQVDLKLSKPQAWRLCPNCQHCENTDETGDPNGACPRCGSAQWSDIGQKRTLLKLRQVFARADARRDRIGDDSDERVPAFYRRQLLVDVHPESHAGAFRMDREDLPFGFEYLRNASFREINFGEVGTNGDTFQVAGRNEARIGFQLCGECGMVRRPYVRRGQYPHALDCKFSRPGVLAQEKDWISSLYLYRELQSEAIRILLPLADVAQSEATKQSFVAALLMGLKTYFQGEVHHLDITEMREPGAGGASASQYLVIYDQVPGGTGYLKELMRSPENLLRLLQQAYNRMAACPCGEDETKDGCYRCILAYRNSRNRGLISRREAMQLLRAILDAKASLRAVDRLGDIGASNLLESKLEERFVFELGTTKGLSILKKVVNGKPGYWIHAQGADGTLRDWELEPQVELGPKEGVKLNTRPDFVLRPVRESDRQAFGEWALYLDGFAYHWDKSQDDARKRMAVLASGRHVWSLGWHDLCTQDEEPEVEANKFLLKHRQQAHLGLYDRLAGRVGWAGSNVLTGLLMNGPFQLLVKVLQEPRATLDALHQASLCDAIAWLHAPSLTTPKGQENGIGLELVVPKIAREFFANLPEKVGGGGLLDGLGSGVEPVRVGVCIPAGALASVDRLKAESSAHLALDASAAVFTKPFERDWRGFWQAANVLQFAPRFTLAVAADLESDLLTNLLEDWEDAITRKGGIHGDPAWDEVISFSTLDEAVLTALKGQGFPVPIVGLDLVVGIETVGTVELAWPDQKVALIGPGDEGVPFPPSGWVVVRAGSTDWLEKIAVALLGKVGPHE